jgi:hypothetical protein
MPRPPWMPARATRTIWGRRWWLYDRRTKVATVRAKSKTPARTGTGMSSLLTRRTYPRRRLSTPRPSGDGVVGADLRPRAGKLGSGTPLHVTLSTQGRLPHHRDDLGVVISEQLRGGAWTSYSIRWR